MRSDNAEKKSRGHRGQEQKRGAHGGDRMSNAVCKKCKKYVGFRKTKGARLANVRCPACGGELEGYSYRKHGWQGVNRAGYAGEAVIA